MKKYLAIVILILFALNTNGNSQSSNENVENDDALKIGVLVPLTGEYKSIGKSVLRAVQLAVTELKKNNIKIYPKDNKSNEYDTYKAAKEFEELGINIVIGPIFYKNLAQLNNINNIVFISLTNKTQKLPKNIISFGINFESQLQAITKYLTNKQIKKTILLTPKSKFSDQIMPIINDHKFNFYKKFTYDTNPKKITSEIESITNYKQRKINLRARVKKLEKSDLKKDKNELKKLKELYTLGKVNFESVLVADFGENLKSVLTSFTYADVSNKDVDFFTLNQWFDESLFNETSCENLIFPSVDLSNYNKFNKKYFEVFNETAIEISILAYDALGLIYLMWNKNGSNFKINEISNNTTYKGMQGEFKIKNNLSHQYLKIYKITEKKFLELN